MGQSALRWMRDWDLLPPEEQNAAMVLRLNARLCALELMGRDPLASEPGRVGKLLGRLVRKLGRRSPPWAKPVDAVAPDEMAELLLSAPSGLWEA